MAPTMGIANQVPQNTNVSAIHTTEWQVHMDIPGPSEQPQGVPSMVLQAEQFSPEDIRQEIQRRICLAREQEIQQQVDLILVGDRLVREEQGRLDEEVVPA
ncbi:hypothetical protein LIER_37522 [Lithospermum erythrorhizon]|uniref:Uncharacterized protein n=1 Tax=Lithospermum erythrorhizon TaxID=34254 RepID=A0AAV3PNA9_LITER